MIPNTFHDVGILCGHKDCDGKYSQKLKTKNGIPWTEEQIRQELKELGWYEVFGRYVCTHCAGKITDRMETFSEMPE